MQQMICPQTAWVGMKLYQKIHKDEEAYKLGECALELLRNQGSQRYAYPLLKELIQIGTKLEKQGKKIQNLSQLENFKDAFEERIYIEDI